MDKKERYYMSSVRLGPKGQIVIPKEARDMFGLQPGDTLVLLADKKKAYGEYRQARATMRELLTVKNNVDRLMSMEEERQEDKDHGHGR